MNIFEAKNQEGRNSYLSMLIIVNLQSDFLSLTQTHPLFQSHTHTHTHIRHTNGIQAIRFS